MRKNLFKRAVLSACLGVSALSAPVASHAAFNITVVFAGGLSPSEQAFFTAAETFWESIITGYAPGVSLTGMTITAKGEAIDGPFNVLGSAGPDTVTSQMGFLFTTTGSMRFDTADIPSLVSGGSFGDVIRHEMGHVLGFGTLWGANGVYPANNGQFTGVNALAQYQTEFNQPLATFVPVELGGGAGTANGHWDEVDGGGSNTGVVDQQGRDRRFELMTGWLNTPSYVSLTTAASFQDIGYAVNLNAVPEPGALLLLLGGIPLVAGLSARRRRQSSAA